MEIEKTLQPLVSCIMPAYNHREFVSHAIRNFLLQNYTSKGPVNMNDGTGNLSDSVRRFEYQDFSLMRATEKSILTPWLKLIWCKHCCKTLTFEVLQ